MADLIQNVQQVYQKWEKKSAPNARYRKNRNQFPHSVSRTNNEEVAYVPDHGNYRQIRDRRNKYRPRIQNFKLPKYDGLAQFKMAPSIFPESKSRPFMGGACAKCVPLSKASVLDTSVYSLGVSNALHIPFFHRNHFSLHMNDVLKLLKPQKPVYLDVSTKVLSSKSVLSAIDKAVEMQEKDCNTDDDIAISEAKVELYEKAKTVLHAMKASISTLCLNLSSVFFHCIFNKVFNGILIHKGQIEILKSVSQENIPVIYLPVHRSHFDYMLISFILYRNSLKIPLVAADEKSYIPFWRYLMKLLGAFFIRKKLDCDQNETDYVYKAVLQSYIVESLKSGQNLEFFTEGDRSISGKPRLPKVGLLSIVVDSLLKGSIEDVYISPVSISYEKIVDRNFVRELLGHPKDKESFFSVLHSVWKMLHLNFGIVRVNFGQPYSLKGATQQQLQSGMEWLRAQLLIKKHDLGFTGESLPAIKYAVDSLGNNLVMSETIEMEWTSSDLENNNVKVIVYKPVMKLPHVLELQYYANSVVPFFLLESMIVNSLYRLVDVDICHFRLCDSKLYVSRDKLIDKALELNSMLQYEFIAASPCADVSLLLNDVLDELIEKEYLHVAGATVVHPNRNLKHSRKSTMAFEESDEEEELQCARDQQLKIDLKEESICHLEFLRNILSPYIESYWLSACALLKLINEVKEESVFIQEIQETAQEKLYKNLLAYEESFSVDTLKNSLKLFEYWHVIEFYIQDGVKIVYLEDNYNNCDKINDIIARIEEFRK
ncbi:glycerol-3-phosphate acyltransferase 1, mitochondrial-like isoform X2 [Stegodyphus dumicola]|uniref:glycerol-3-phosphate acyltransferase 1, mitochondrial-like isoform X2 n=1 Tax=Stegodyphus dumicola TaxID=202533 RepID=UPI0015AE20C2|nr:glycerol-3-phosphate acyltransferase 1, mitochondrial-like isoform X2 [Stegodyphus dumicola]